MEKTRASTRDRKPLANRSHGNVEGKAYSLSRVSLFNTFTTANALIRRNLSLSLLASQGPVLIFLPGSDDREDFYESKMHFDAGLGLLHLRLNKLPNHIPP